MKNAERKDIKNFTLKELKAGLLKEGEPAYRAEQIFSWIYRKAVNSFDGMKNIPALLMDKLEKLYYISALECVKALKSYDGTEKFVFKLSDSNLIESVLIPSGSRRTLCLSTQVGCKYACAFCVSGLKRFVRNLVPAEIINQILFAGNRSKNDITNYVFMGMGEPLDNYDNVVKAIRIMNEPRGLAIGSRRITVSTCGIIPGIEKLKVLGLQINLSVSLHAANDKLRNRLVPINRIYSIEKLIKALKDYVDNTKRVITLEYVLMDNINDSTKDAEELVAIAKKLKAKVNLIPCSRISGLRFTPPPDKKVKIFKRELIKNKINVTIRESKGEDIKAACGQLAGSEP